MSSIELDTTCGPDLSFHNLTIVQPSLGFADLRPGRRVYDEGRGQADRELLHAKAVSPERRRREGGPSRPRTRPANDTLDAALSAGSLHISETSDAGSVPEIRVRNTGRRPVLIIDGEELVGAKQNRTVNLSIMVDAAADVTVPVTSVEAGRWNSRSRTFASAPRTHFAAGRAAKSAQVSASLMNAGTARADQGQVWEGIAERSSRLRAHSDTRAMADIFERNADPDRGLRARLSLSETSGRGRVHPERRTNRARPLRLRAHLQGALLEDSARLCTRCACPARRGIRAAGASTETADIRRAHATRLMTDALEAPRREFRLPGLSDTWRLLAPKLTGGGISLDGRVVHLSAFRTKAA